MVATTRMRHSVLQPVSQCLMQLVESKTAADAIAALSGLFQALPIVWHTVDVFSAGGVRKRIVSSRCPRGFAPFVTRLGFLKRQDGTYQGTFAESNVILVKLGSSNGTEDCLVSAVAFAKNSPLNDGPIITCIGALIHEALSRARWFEAHVRRSAMLESLATHHDAFVALFDPDGSLVEQYPSDNHAGLPSTLFQSTSADRQRARLRPARRVVCRNGREYNAHSRWIAGTHPLDDKYWFVHGQTIPAASNAVTERLRNYGLSKRETQVAELVFSGKTNQTIADVLFISRDTVKTHCKHIFGKLGISRRTEFFSVMGQQ